MLRTFQTPTGLTTTYEHAPRGGEQSYDLELKALVLPTFGRTEYYYADHQFYYPLHNTGQTIEYTRVITQKKVGTFTWNYAFPSGQGTDNITVVTDPKFDRSEYTYLRYASSGPDRIWKAGLLEKVRVLDGGVT